MKFTALQTLWWFFAFLMSAVVTFYLPGTNAESAFVDTMGIAISMGCFSCGSVWAILGFRAYYQDHSPDRLTRQIMDRCDITTPYTSFDYKRAEIFLNEKLQK